MGGGRVCSMWDAAGALRCIFSGSDLVTSAATHGGAHISTPSMSPTSPLCSLLLLLCCCSVLLLYSALLHCSLYCAVTTVIWNMGWENICTATVQYSDLHINIPAVVNDPNIWFSRKWDLMLSREIQFTDFSWMSCTATDMFPYFWLLTVSTLDSYVSILLVAHLQETQLNI